MCGICGFTGEGDRALLAKMSATLQCQPYPQLYGDFISCLFRVDLLCNCGPESPKYLPGGTVPHFRSRCCEPHSTD